MTNATDGISTDIKVNDEILETIHRFKYLGAIVSVEGSKPEVLTRIGPNNNNDPLQTEHHLERQKHYSLLKNQTDDVFFGHINIELHLRNLDPNHRHRKKNLSYGDEMLL